MRAEEGVHSGATWPWRLAKEELEAIILSPHGVLNIQPLLIPLSKHVGTSLPMASFVTDLWIRLDDGTGVFMDTEHLGYYS